MKWEYGNLVAGDHIRVNRKHYFHHGVYIGNNEVIHYTAKNNDGIASPNDVKVRKTSLDFFLGDGAVEKAVYSHHEKKNCFSSEERVKNATSFLGEGNYNFVNNNCEHFANRCCYKKNPETQIDNWRKKVAGIFKHD